MSAPGLSGTVSLGAIGEFTVLSFDLESAEQTEIVVGFAEAGLAFGGIAYTSATGGANNESYEVSDGTLRVVNQGRQMFSVFLPQVAEDPGAGPSLILIDEAAAHLDSVRRPALFDGLLANPGQAWLTGTDQSLFEAFGPRAQLFEVRDGRVYVAEA